MPDDLVPSRGIVSDWQRFHIVFSLIRLIMHYLKFKVPAPIRYLERTLGDRAPAWCNDLRQNILSAIYFSRAILSLLRQCEMVR